MTRQRIRPSLRRSIYEDCPCCGGTGQVKTAESMAIEVMRTLMNIANREQIHRIVVDVHERVSNFLNNRKRRDITRLEESYNVTILINARNDVGPEHLVLRCQDDIGNDIRNLTPADSKSRY
jgi:ribonuclease E